MIDGKNFFDQPVKSDLRTYDNIRKITTCQGDDYAAGFVLDYSYFKDYYKMIAIYLRKQQTLNAYSKAMQQINFIGYLNEKRGATMFFITEEVKETILDFLQGTVKVFCINITLI